MHDTQVVVDIQIGGLVSKTVAFSANSSSWAALRSVEWREGHALPAPGVWVLRLTWGPGVASPWRAGVALVVAAVKFLAGGGVR